jgi:hypothetical protein
LQFSFQYNFWENTLSRHSLSIWSLTSPSNTIVPTYFPLRSIFTLLNFSNSH